MRDYEERLYAPIGWWLVTAVCVALLGAELWAGFGWVAAVACYAVLAGVCGAFLWHWSSARVRVTGGELQAGTARLPLRQAGEVAALDERQTKAIRGPLADPSAFLFVRPYLRRSVYVEVNSNDGGNASEARGDAGSFGSEPEGRGTSELDVEGAEAGGMGRRAGGGASWTEQRGTSGGGRQRRRRGRRRGREGGGRGAGPRRRAGGRAGGETSRGSPYWLIGTRRPDELAAAIRRARGSGP